MIQHLSAEHADRDGIVADDSATGNMCFRSYVRSFVRSRCESTATLTLEHDCIGSVA